MLKFSQQYAESDDDVVEKTQCQDTNVKTDEQSQEKKNFQWPLKQFFQTKYRPKQEKFVLSADQQDDILQAEQILYRCGLKTMEQCTILPKLDLFGLQNQNLFQGSPQQPELSQTQKPIQTSGRLNGLPPQQQQIIPQNILDSKSPQLLEQQQQHAPLGLGSKLPQYQHVPLGLGLKSPQLWQPSLKGMEEQKLGNQRDQNQGQSSQQNPFSQEICQQSIAKVFQQKERDGLRKNSSQKIQEYQTQILQQILNYNLHLNREYTRIYRIEHNMNYLRGVKYNFEQEYSHFIKLLQGKQTLIRWYEQQIKPFHQQFDIPVIIDSFWKEYIDKQQILTVQCRLDLFHSDPFKNQNLLRDTYLEQINEYINLQDPLSQENLKRLLSFSQKHSFQDIVLVQFLSAISGMNIMVHKDKIPSKQPILIVNGQEVSKDDFPIYDIIQLYTADLELFYQIIPSTLDDKTKLDQYIHYDIIMQEIYYNEVAKNILNYQKKRENEYEQNIFQNQLIKNQLNSQTPILQLMQTYVDKMEQKIGKLTQERESVIIRQKKKVQDIKKFNELEYELDQLDDKQQEDTD